MRAGRMDRLITLQVATETQDSFGATVQTWATLADVWAERVPVSGRENFVADQMANFSFVRFRIRHRTDLTTKNRILDSGNVYNIRAINEIGRKEGLDVVAEAINP